ncbi:MAG: hypothetical protein IJF54_00215 [Clostridia bacterium]|nr:hypothetical protein [Clostridia bacterium]
MDDLAERLTQILQDPKGMETVKNLASSFFGSQATQQPATDIPQMPSIPFSADQLQGIMKITSALNNGSQSDHSANLLIALKPHLSDERQQKVDKAVKMMKIIKILPLIQDSGLFSML